MGVLHIATLGTRHGGIWSSVMAQMVKNLPEMQETQVWSLGWEDPLEKGMETHSSILAWRIPWTEEADTLESMGSQRVGHDWAANTDWLTDGGICRYKGRLEHAWFFKRIQRFQLFKHLISFSIWRLFWYLFWSRILCNTLSLPLPYSLVLNIHYMIIFASFLSLSPIHLIKHWILAIYYKLYQYTVNIQYTIYCKVIKYFYFLYHYCQQFKT